MERKSAGMRSAAIHRSTLKTLTMRFPAIAALLILLTAPAAAAESAERTCLDKEAQRNAVSSHQAITLGQAIRTIRPKNKGEVVRARLCRGPNGLVYMLTLLSRSGKVTRATVDAANGAVVSGG